MHCPEISSRLGRYQSRRVCMYVCMCVCIASEAIYTSTWDTWGLFLFRRRHYRCDTSSYWKPLSIRSCKSRSEIKRGRVNLSARFGELMGWIAPCNVLLLRTNVHIDASINTGYVPIIDRIRFWPFRHQCIFTSSSLIFFKHCQIFSVLFF